jgi:hypothetical protein
LVAALQRSLASCDAALAHVRDATLGDTVPYYGFIADWFDHYGE